jgi:hypothetical protein
MVDDVRLASLGRSDISFYGRMGGNVPAAEEIVEQVRSALEQGDESRNSKRSEVRRVKALA